jgi:hypothetical protein
MSMGVLGVELLITYYLLPITYYRSPLPSFSLQPSASFPLLRLVSVFQFIWLSTLDVRHSIDGTCLPASGAALRATIPS